MSAGLGRGLGALGKAIGSKKLGGLGDKLKAKGTEIAPRISEGLLGRQEAALQHLLRQFRQGKTDDALRHAIPIGKEPGRGSRTYGSDRLPTRGLIWSLAGLFGGGRGGTSIWSGGHPDTWRDLVAEYHKAAREAANRGDFRRAALIYAKLLSDFRAAASMLAKGGLHREAGILFRDKVRDPTRAAHEFAQSGDHEEALRLYRESHLYVDAGDLLRGSAKKISRSPNTTGPPIASWNCGATTSRRATSCSRKLVAPIWPEPISPAAGKRGRRRWPRPAMPARVRSA